MIAPRFRRLAARPMMARAAAACAAAWAWSARMRRRIAAVMAAALLVGVVVAITALDLRVADIAPGALLVHFLVLTPALIVLNAAALMISARAVGQRMGFGFAAAATSTGAVASLLPSGATITRATALYASGARLRDVVGLMTATTVLWIGLGFLLGAYPIWVAGHAAWAILALVGAVPLTAGLVYVVWRTRLGWAVLITASKLAALVAVVARIWVAFLVISVPIQPLDATIFTSAAIIGSSVVVVPAGLGVAEAMGALLAPLTSATAAAAFTALALTRILDLTFNGMVVIAVLVHRRGLGPPVRRWRERAS